MAAAYVLLFLPLHILIARSEEIHLVRLYGAAYETYRRAVPAVLPWRRFRGAPYGMPSPFKLQNSREGLKAAGYLAGMAAVLAFKYWRQGLHPPALAPLPAGWGIAAGVLALAAVVLRQRVRSNTLRAFHTVLAIVCVCLLVIHLPGAWLSAPAQTPEIQLAPAPLPSPGQEVFLMERERPRPSVWVRLAQGISSNLELIGGLGGFSAAAFSLLARLHHPGGRNALPGSSGRAWEMDVGPKVDERNKLAVLATFKRRF